MQDWQNGGFGLYVHWPFCAAKCPYCDFNSHVRDVVDQKVWADALCSEIKNATELTRGRALDSIFFGGGTPSLMDPETVGAVIETARSAWAFSNAIEISLEANPTSVEANKFAGFANAGVNRVSMGVQSLRDEDLKRLGRMHSVADAQRAFEIAKDCFDRVSFDLIYARQDQSVDAWQSELAEALSMAVDHLSLYQLTLEPNTPFYQRAQRGGLKGLPSDLLSADLFSVTQDIMSDHGYEAYEVSNHARPGAQSKHNLIYWRYGDYVGVGPGAHGRVTIGEKRYATSTPLKPETWLKQVRENGFASEQEMLSSSDQATEYLLMSLRLSEGSSIKRYAALCGHSLDQGRIDTLREDGFLINSDDNIAATQNGRMVLNAMLRELLA